jgi:hypothetical protein
MNESPMQNPHYVLDNHVPYVEPEEDKWLWWMKNENHPLAVTTVGAAEIRTTFVGYHPHHQPQTDQPLLFLTRVTGHNGSATGLERYSATWEEALARHERVTQRLAEWKPKKPTLSMPKGNNDPRPQVRDNTFLSKGSPIYDDAVVDAARTSMQRQVTDEINKGAINLENMEDVLRRVNQVCDRSAENLVRALRGRDRMFGENDREYADRMVLERTHCAQQAQKV